MLKIIENWTFEDNEEKQNVNEVVEEMGKEYGIFCAAGLSE